MQLIELYRMQIDAEQNNTIQFLTVVTTIFVPLTLITSWYGMNFENMPELEWPFSYLAVIVICLAVIVLELLYFRRKKWL